MHVLITRHPALPSLTGSAQATQQPTTTTTISTTQTHQPTNNPHVQTNQIQAIIGACRDLRGVTAATQNRKAYCALFELLYPQVCG